MLTKAQSKYIRSLTQQKFRNEYKAFVAEGEKIALEWLRSDSPIEMIVATAEWAEENSLLVAQKGAALHIVKERELAAISTLQTPNKVLVVAKIPEATLVPKLKQWYLALDEIQDPGNMGTLIRIADWFGIKHVVCSPGCADVYNPKVVQSAMGGHLRVNVYEAELAAFLSGADIPVIAATLQGKSAYEMSRLECGVLVIGNESKGISPELLTLATHCVTIPRRGGPESLNAAVSAGILCALLVPC